ncbi:very-long-chain aldehyde decarbonylase CER1-like isoform X1 [Mercurialis annua]|uniref:very-long-chain aldehyde decarbonylase CER1-like isoform X1 n=1 Tax=Mercurialis annua TaxID=3986 RepID=UPI00215F6B1A|nr:very-long-chain aldehyde decarbonylase CER1-like isoform X1 [Mercurialis annua]
MATKPGVLTDWPWKSLGNFKYMILAPWVVHSIYSFTVKSENERDFTNFLIFPSIIFRYLHSQIWISVSRYQTAKGNKKIVDKPIEFHQVDRETNWDDQIIMYGIMSYFASMLVPWASKFPIWRTDGVVLTMLLHAGPVEFLYYWFHRALHHHYLYSRYHSHHHSSLVTQPITSVIHPFAEVMVYLMLFAIPPAVVVLSGRASVVALYSYMFYVDFMNNMGHCNFEILPKFIFSIFPPLKYIIYTPSYHSLHHTQFRTNYSLFMPFYDYIYDTIDKSSDSLYETSLEKPQEFPTLVHLTHFTTPASIYHLRLGFASFASRPLTCTPSYVAILSPFTYLFTVLVSLFGRVFVSERNIVNNVVSQTWIIPRYKTQYLRKWESRAINRFIEEAILEADAMGCKVLSLGLLNQAKELNRYGEVFVEKHPKLKLKLVDGSSLAAAVIINSIPKGTTQIFIGGKLTKVAKTVASALCHKGIQIVVLNEEEHGIPGLQTEHVDISKRYEQKIWLIGDDITENEQLKAPKGTLFIPFTQFPPKRVRKDCFYHVTPAMLTPNSLQNLDSCENWIPRRAMSAWRVAGIIHSLEDWKVHECGSYIFNMDKIWEASLHHGFYPLSLPN